MHGRRAPRAERQGARGPSRPRLDRIPGRRLGWAIRCCLQSLVRGHEPPPEVWERIRARLSPHASDRQD